MKLFGVEILNEGFGSSVDDSVLEMQATFVARSVAPLFTGMNYEKGMHRPGDGCGPKAICPRASAALRRDSAVHGRSDFAHC